MYDDSDFEEPASAITALVAGVVAAGAVCGIFILAYLLAPNLSLGWTFVIAFVLAGLVAVAGGSLLLRRRERLPPAARHAVVEHPIPLAPAVDAAADESTAAEQAPPAKPVKPARALAPAAADAELEARLAGLREDAAAKRRSKLPEERSQAQAALGEELYEAGMRGATSPGRKEQRIGLAQVRQAMNAFRRALDDRTREAGAGQWARTQIALAACLYTLGVGEGDREQIAQAAAGYAAALDAPELTPEERTAAEAGLAQSEGALAAMAEPDRGEMMF